MKHIPPSGLAVVESRWWKHSNMSIAPLLDVSCNMFDAGPLSFHYEMANSAVAFQEAIPRIAAMGHIKYLYIAAHGNKEGIECYNGDLVSRAEISNIISNATFNRTALRGIHFGVCDFGSYENLAAIALDNRKLAWVSGYSRRADWLGSAALDMQLFYHLLGSHETEPHSRIEDAAKAVKTLAEGACREFGISICVRRGAQPANLMEEE
ncbi:hypothetical protein NKZ03_30775 [Sinorhizobium meliloti]|uniref:hypothetical protein n=1 Tax=Rhizobium meliloti TaxID=382 RepID=UPI003D649A90